MIEDVLERNRQIRYCQENLDSIIGKITETIGWNTDQKPCAIDTLKKDLMMCACVP